jgi:hypothetical protein
METLPVSRPHNRNVLIITGLNSLINPLAFDDGFFLDLDRSGFVVL